MSKTFAGFELYRLSGVRLTEEEFGRGSYAVVLRLEYRGLKCAGKQLYPVLYEQGVGDTVRRFEEECRLLAQMRHPNIVQFIGVYFEEGSRVPILVMEFLPTTLARCIDTYGVLPEEVSYSILHDVALGLYHLHSQTPPIVHRDLSANNVLLASNMTAKISDLGVARILNLTPEQMSCMTSTPGTPAYMPPEAMRATPRYDASIDEFSYGILMIHVLSGRWPLPLREPTYVNPKNRAQLLAVSEAERRDEYLRHIGNAHPLMDLILRCVSNDPEQRATAAQMVQRMEHMTRHSLPAFFNRVEMLQRIRVDATEKGSLREEVETFAAEYEQSQLEREELIQQHRAEVKQVRAEVTAELNAQNTAAQAQLRRAIHRLQQMAQHYEEEIESSELTHSIGIEQTRLQLARTEAHQSVLESQIVTLQARLRSENEMHQGKLMAEIEAREQEKRALRIELETELSRVRRANRNLQATVATKDKEIQSKNTELSSKSADIFSHQEETAKVVSEKERLQAVVLSKDREIESKEQELESLESELARVRRANRNLQATVASKDKEIQSKDSDILSKRAEILAHQAVTSRLQAVVLSKDREIESRQQEVNVNKQELSVKSELIAAMSMDILTKEAAAVTKDATLAEKDSELVTRNAVLDSQSSTIRGLGEQLTRAKEFLSGKKPQLHPFHPQAKITWEPCRDLPVEMTYAKAIVIRDEVYCGGGEVDDCDDQYRIFCYSPSEDTWNTLPACDVRWFGLSQVRGKLVTVGGRKKSFEVTNEVYEFNEVAHTWKQSIPPMPTARTSPAVLSHHSTLTVAGGNTGYARTAVVEVFKEETSQWHATEPLPFHWHIPSSLLINNRWYLLGGRTNGERYSNQAVCADVDLLLQKALPRGQASADRDSTKNSAWEVLPNTPHYRPAAATFGASLLAVGGSTTEKYTSNPQAAVHVYSPCTKAWIHVSDLPASRAWTATAMLSPTELLVISGWNNGKQNSVYKGLLRIK